MKTYTESEVRTMLRRACEQAGSQAKWGLDHGVHLGQVCYTLSGERRPTPKIAKALGLRRMEQPHLWAQAEVGNHEGE
jgi:hypothetical protein